MNKLEEILQRRLTSPKQKFTITLTEVDIEVLQDMFKEVDRFKSKEEMIECALELLLLYEYDLIPHLENFMLNTLKGELQ